MDSEFNPYLFKKAMSYLNPVLKNRKLHAFIFLGDPQIPELGSEVFNILDITSVSKILRDHLDTLELTIEVYSSFNKDYKSITKLIDTMDCLEVYWKVSPLYYFKNNIKDFIKNISLCKQCDVLGEITCIVRDSYKKEDSYIYSILKNIFKEELITTAPLRGEECLYNNTSNYVTHELEFTNSKKIKVSFYKLQCLKLSFFGLKCDILNHLEVTLSGDFYSCSTGYELQQCLPNSNKQSLYQVCSDFTCPYSSCKHNDNMSLS